MRISKTEELTNCILDLLYQFAYDGDVGGIPVLTTSGLSALETAFDLVNWSDPHPIPELKCQYDKKCPKRATCGTPTKDGYKQLCGKHYSEVTSPTKKEKGI